MGPVETILTDAVTLLSDDTNWTQGSAFRDDEDKPIELNSHKTIRSFCARGAIYHVALSKSITAHGNALDLLKNALKDVAERKTSAVAYNDSKTYEDVLRLFHKAIDIAKKEGI